MHVKNRPDLYKNIENVIDLDNFKDLLENKDIHVFIMDNTDTKEIVAYSIVRITYPQNLQLMLSNKFAFLDDFCVGKKYKRQGVGTLLLDYIKNFLKVESISSLQLIVWEFNKDAIKFYKKMGMSTMH